MSVAAGKADEADGSRAIHRDRVRSAIKRSAPAVRSGAGKPDECLIAENQAPAEVDLPTGQVEEEDDVVSRVDHGRLHRGRWHRT